MARPTTPNEKVIWDILNAPGETKLEPLQKALENTKTLCEGCPNNYRSDGCPLRKASSLTKPITMCSGYFGDL